MQALLLAAAIVGQIGGMNGVGRDGIPLDPFPRDVVGPITRAQTLADGFPPPPIQVPALVPPPAQRLPPPAVIRDNRTARAQFARRSSRRIKRGL